MPTFKRREDFGDNSEALPLSTFLIYIYSERSFHQGENVRLWRKYLMTSPDRTRKSITNLGWLTYSNERRQKKFKPIDSNLYTDKTINN